MLSESTEQSPINLIDEGNNAADTDLEAPYLKLGSVRNFACSALISLEGYHMGILDRKSMIGTYIRYTYDTYLT